MKTILITVVDGYLDSMIIDHLKAAQIGHNAYISNGKLLDIQGYIYGNCGISMFNVICTKLDKLTAETLNR